MALPYYKRFPRDFLDGTIGLSFEVKGAYAIVLDLIYMRDGRLPDDARYIAGQLGCSVRKWNSIREELLARRKLKVELGFISNFRADYLLEETRKYQDKQAENRRVVSENSDLAERSSNHTDTEAETDSSAAVVVAREPAANDVSDGAADWPETDARGWAAKLCEAAGTVRLDLTRSPGLATTLGRLAAWKRDGASWEHDVVPVVTSIAQKRGQAIGSWKFFDAPIAQSIADNRAALSIPEAQTHASQTDDRSPSPKLQRKRANLARHYAGAEQAADLMAARASY